MRTMKFLFLFSLVVFSSASVLHILHFTCEDTTCAGQLYFEESLVGYPEDTCNYIMEEDRYLYWTGCDVACGNDICFYTTSTLDGCTNKTFSSPTRLPKQECTAQTSYYTQFALCLASGDAYLPDNVTYTKSLYSEVNCAGDPIQNTYYYVPEEKCFQDSFESCGLDDHEIIFQVCNVDILVVTSNCTTLDSYLEESPDACIGGDTKYTCNGGPGCDTKVTLPNPPSTSNIVLPIFSIMVMLMTFLLGN